MKLVRLAVAVLSAAVLSHALSAAAFAADRTPIQERADRFLSLVNASYQALYTVENRAAWDEIGRAHV